MPVVMILVTRISPYLQMRFNFPLVLCHWPKQDLEAMTSPPGYEAGLKQLKDGDIDLYLPKWFQWFSFKLKTS